MKEYTYFVSYSYNKGLTSGFGSGTFNINCKIDSEETYKSVIDFIKENNNFDIVSIMNFILLKEEVK